MNNSNVTLVVPQWFVDAIHLFQHDWFPFVGTIVLALIVIAVTAFVKGHASMKHETAIAKAIVVRFTAFFSIALSAIASLAYFVSNNMPILHNLPYVGTYMGEVLGVVWTIYQAGIKFRSIEAKAAVWATGKATPPVPSAPTDDLL